MTRWFPIAGLLASCSATSQEPCTEADLAAIIRAHEARLAIECIGQGLDCDAYPVENARFESDLRTWVRCDKEPPR